MQIALLLALFFCHFLGDYTPLSTPWMLQAKQHGKPLFPIAIHACIHASLMGFVLLVFFDIGGTLLLSLSLFQFVTHFIIDIFKGRLNGWFPILQSPTQPWHWIVFGLDQYLHTIVIITMSYWATHWSKL